MTPQPTSRIRVRAEARAAAAAQAPAAPTPTPAPTYTPTEAAAVRRSARGRELEASLEAYFYRCVRTQLAGRPIKIAPTVKGLPDRLVALPGGRLRLVELKTETGKLSPAQRLRHAELAEVGVIVDVVYGRSGIDAWVRAQYPTTAELRKSTRK